MSQIESTAPTSWKCTFSIATPCTFASAAPSALKIAIASALARSGSAAGFDHLHDVRQVPVLLLVLVLDVKLRCRDALPLDLLDAEPRPRSKRIEPGEQSLRAGARVDQRAHSHIAGNSGKTVEICDFHSCTNCGNISPALPLSAMCAEPLSGVSSTFTSITFARRAARASPAAG